MRFFKNLSEDNRAAVFKICDGFSVYLVPLDGLGSTEQFKHDHDISIKEVDDPEGGETNLPKFAFITLVKKTSATATNFLNPTEAKEIEKIEEPEPVREPSPEPQQPQ